MQFCFVLRKGPTDPNGVASLTINAPNVTGAEQDIMILDTDGKAIAVIQMQPGYDRFEIEQS